jgi:hypothetical protein
VLYQLSYQGTSAHVRLVYFSYLHQTTSGRSDSNRRHSAWKADALPTELRPHFHNTSVRRERLKSTLWREVDSNHRSRRDSRFTVCPRWPLGYPSKHRTTGFRRLGLCSCPLTSKHDLREAEGDIQLSCRSNALQPLHRTNSFELLRKFSHLGDANCYAGDGNRTHDLLITNQLLYQLSYTDSSSTLSKSPG